MRKSPSSVSPRSRMKSTHCSTNRGARRGPYFRSWWTVSSRRCPKIPEHGEELVRPSAIQLGSGKRALGTMGGRGRCQGPKGSSLREQIRIWEGTHQAAGPWATRDREQEGTAGRGPVLCYRIFLSPRNL